MGGAILGGKLAAEEIVDKSLGNPTKGLKEVQPHIVEAAAKHVAKEPRGIKGEGAIAFGGGAVLSKAGMDLLREQYGAQFGDDLLWRSRWLREHITWSQPQLLGGG